MVNVLTIGYSSYAMDSETAATILALVAAGKIKNADKKYNTGQPLKVVVRGPIEVQMDLLEEVTDKEAELMALKSKIAELEAKLNG